MSRLSAGMLALVLLGACAAKPEGPSAEQQAAADRELAEYEQLRAAGQFGAAEGQAERLQKRYPGTRALKQLKRTLDDTHAQAEAERERQRLAALWEYQTFAIAGGEQRTAALYSRVESDPEAEVQPVPDARLVLRRHPEWGRSAYLLLNQRSLVCGPPCTLSLRFDQGEAQAWRGKPADSGQGPALFIVDEARFLNALRQAQRLRIELPSSGALVPVFEFELGGFAAERLDPP